MSNLIALEVHFDRTVLSLLVTAEEARQVEMAVLDGESVNVQSRNWISKDIIAGVYTINGKRVNYLLGKPDTDSPWDDPPF